MSDISIRQDEGKQDSEATLVAMAAGPTRWTQQLATWGVELRGNFLFQELRLDAHLISQAFNQYPLKSEQILSTERFVTYFSLPT